MKVFVLTWQEWDDMAIIGVFSTLEAARLGLDAQINTYPKRARRTRGQEDMLRAQYDITEWGVQ